MGTFGWKSRLLARRLVLPLACHPLHPHAPTAPCFAVEVRSFAGKTTESRFESCGIGYADFFGAPRLPGQRNAQSHVLDDLKFNALPASVPEPGTYGLFALGFAALTDHLSRPRG